MAQNNETQIKFEKEDFYTIIADTEKNRIFMRIFGAWEEESQVPNYNTDMEKAVTYMKEGFTTCVTLDEKKAPKFGMTKLHKKQQEILMSAGNSKTAVFTPGKQILQTMTLNVVGKLSGMSGAGKVKIFKQLEAAEAWLEE